MADLTMTRVATTHRRLECELDDLVGSGVLLDPTALRRLRGVLDDAIPVADAYAERVAGLSEDAVA